MRIVSTLAPPLSGMTSAASGVENRITISMPPKPQTHMSALESFFTTSVVT